MSHLKLYNYVFILYAPQGIFCSCITFFLMVHTASNTEFVEHGKEVLNDNNYHIYLLVAYVHG